MSEEPESKDATAQPEPAQPAKKKGGLPRLPAVVLLPVIIVVALGAAFLVSTKVLKPMLAKAPSAAVAGKDKPTKTEEKKTEKKKKPAKEAKHENESKEKKDGKEGEHQAEGGTETPIFKIDGIVVNPAATGGSRFLSTSLAVELDSEDGMAAFTSQEIKIRDALIAILSSKTVTELADAQMRELIRRQILRALNQICQPARAKAVYFVDFVLQ